jgi:carboxymethylenebutenolidase
VGETLTLTASDGHRLGAYRADPAAKARGGIVVIQEIFGVNHHIRSICDRLAADGYAAVAPALFDRIQRDYETGYSPQEVAAARELANKRDWDAMMRDTQAALDNLQGTGPSGIVGFCMGGSVAFLAAARLSGLAASVAFYGGQIIQFADETPRCPMQMHFGERDAHISMQDVETIRSKQPKAEIHVYPADHGFNCDERGSFDAPSARLAWSRTLDWFATHLR